MAKETIVRDLMEQSGVAFGTSGARGLVAAMTDRVCYGYTEGLLRHLLLQGSWRVGDQVALGGDLRPSTPAIIAACSQAVRDLGGEPIFCGFVPTPALAFYALEHAIPAIMVTGSHIPDDRNGIKFYRPEGEILKEDEPGILGQAITDREWAYGDSCLGRPPMAPIVGVQEAYISRYLDFFGRDALRGCRVGVYQHSAVGRDILTRILLGMDAEVVPLGRSETFIPVDTEAIRPEDAAFARRWAAEHNLHAIASTDGDSDRPLLADETGKWLRGDVLAMLCARELSMQTVVTPVSSNSMVETGDFFDRVIRTRIGSPFVIEAMQAALSHGDELVCGYEANGGFLLGSDVVRGEARLTALPTRDAVLPIIAVLVAARARSVSALVDALPRRATHSDRLVDFPPDRRDALIGWLLVEDDRDVRLNDAFCAVAGARLGGVDLTDGVRMAFANGHVIHLRGSGNAPELRCYTEAGEPEAARALAAAALKIVIDRTKNL